MNVPLHSQVLLDERQLESGDLQIIVRLGVLALYDQSIHRRRATSCSLNWSLKSRIFKGISISFRTVISSVIKLHSSVVEAKGFKEIYFLPPRKLIDCPQKRSEIRFIGQELTGSHCLNVDFTRKQAFRDLQSPRILRNRFIVHWYWPAVISNGSPFNCISSTLKL